MDDPKIEPTLSGFSDLFAEVMAEVERTKSKDNAANKVSKEPSNNPSANPKTKPNEKAPVQRVMPTAGAPSFSFSFGGKNKDKDNLADKAAAALKDNEDALKQKAQEDAGFKDKLKRLGEMAHSLSEMIPSDQIANKFKEIAEMIQKVVEELVNKVAASRAP
jgi:hypothetical protein